LLLKAVFSLQGTWVFDSGAGLKVDQEVTKVRLKSALGEVKTWTEVRGGRI